MKHCHRLWGEEDRTFPCLKYPQRYAVRAEAVLPERRRTRGQLLELNHLKDAELAEFDAALAAIESATETSELVSAKDFRRRPSAP